MSSPDYAFLYDALGRRESFNDFGVITDYIYDGLMAVETEPPSLNPQPNFLTTPGGEVLAYSATSGSTTNTFVPLTDVLGSTLGLTSKRSAHSRAARSGYAIGDFSDRDS